MGTVGFQFQKTTYQRPEFLCKFGAVVLEPLLSPYEELLLCGASCLHCGAFVLHITIVLSAEMPLSCTRLAGLFLAVNNFFHFCASCLRCETFCYATACVYAVALVVCFLFLLQFILSSQ